MRSLTYQPLYLYLLLYLYLQLRMHLQVLLQWCGNFGTLLASGLVAHSRKMRSATRQTMQHSAQQQQRGGRVFYVRCLSLYYYLLPASCPLMWLPVSPRAENSDGCSFTSISLRRLFNLFVCMNRKNVHDIASSAISSTELKRDRTRERE